MDIIGSFEVIISLYSHPITVTRATQAPMGTSIDETVAVVLGTVLWCVVFGNRVDSSVEFALDGSVEFSVKG